MPHNCVDWTTYPPTRKIPSLLILTRGDEHVYTAVPKEFRTLEEVSRREFDLDGVEIFFSSSCLNLCHGLPARITESAWEHISPYIGCATVETLGPQAVPLQDIPRQVPRPTASANTEDERDSSAKRTLSSNTDKEDENEHLDHGLTDKPDASAREAVRDEQSAPSDHGNEREGASAPEDQPEEPWEEEVSAIPPRKSRNRRRLLSEDEDAGEESEREHDVPVRPQVPPIASPPKATQQNKEVKKKMDSGYRAQPDLQSDEPSHQLSKPIKQEKVYDGHRESQSQHETRTQAQVSSENLKLMIRVAHRPSKQESKFTTKSTTKVGKVLGAVCKSFGLDVGQATLYLIVPMEDEDGQVENLFPCDKNDTIARAGAELDAESRFLLKFPGEV